METSKATWEMLRRFAQFVASQESPPRDIPQLSAALWSAWKLRRSPNRIGYRELTDVAGFLKLDARLPMPVREAMAARLPRVKVQEKAFTPAEFQAVRAAARSTLRSALLRIRHNAELLTAWRTGKVDAATPQGLVGEALDELARTGHVPRYEDESGKMRVINRYRLALGGEGAEATWKRLYLTRVEAAALVVLLVSELGLNATTAFELAVPTTTSGSGSAPTPVVYRLTLEKRRRGSGHHFESRNLADVGASSAGRLITEILEVTEFARAFIAASDAEVDRLIVWHESLPLPPAQQGTARAVPLRVGPFGLGVTSDDCREWAVRAGLPGSPLRRGRKTVNVLHRREPGQNSQDTHDRVYVMGEPQVHEAAIDVIAEGAQEAADAARLTVFAARLTEKAAGDAQETATTGCSDYMDSPFGESGMGCRASFLLCTACPNARVAPAHYPRLALLHQALGNLRGALDPAEWRGPFADAHARLEDLKRHPRIGDEVWRAALATASDLDRQMIDHLLNGHFDQ
ncbi:hypothetical protein [Kitasatospora sp. NPDC005856]|uniref:hypothetical protein n=1 Tax=Kitasatospora sp. NPDC005856 TaxID=3154566 RepID=UPI0033CF4BAC